VEHTDFDADNINFEGHLEWVGPEIETFLCPEMATIKAGAIWDPDPHQSEPDPHQGICSTAYSRDFKKIT
jgi:hypothetical protein